MTDVTNTADHSAKPPTPVPYVLLDLRQVEEIVGFRRTTIQKLRATGEFPQPIRIGPRMIRWRSDDIAAWMEQLDHSINESAA